MTQPQLQAALKNLLEDLNQIAENHGEIFDTDVREQLFEAVYVAYLRPREGYELPERFGLYEAEGNQQVRTALQKYLDTVLPLSADLNPQQRLDAFQDPEVTTEDDLTPDEFFGWVDNLDHLEA